MSCRDAPCHQSCSVCGKSHCTTNHNVGGGGGNGGDPPPPDPPTPEPGKVEEVPCTPEDEALSVHTSMIEAYFNANGMQEFIQLHQNSVYEHSRSLYYNSIEGKWSTGPITTDNKTNSVTQHYDENCQAFIHNHPYNYSAPSMTDVISLAEANGLFSDLKTSFVVSADGSIYALVVVDRSKAGAFYNAQNGNKDDLNNEYGILKNRLTPKSSLDITSVHALAYMLEKYGTGMKIMRLEQNGYRSRSSEITLDEDGWVKEAKLKKCK